MAKVKHIVPRSMRLVIAIVARVATCYIHNKITW